MKFNWVNVLAVVLIIGGVCLLVVQHMHEGKSTRHIPTVEEAKADIERQVEGKLGRPLSEAETDMIDVSKSGERITITLHEPLTGRLKRAIHDAKLAAAGAAPSAETAGEGMKTMDGGFSLTPSAPTTLPAPVGTP